MKCELKLFQLLVIDVYISVCFCSFRGSEDLNNHGYIVTWCKGTPSCTQPVILKVLLVAAYN